MLIHVNKKGPCYHDEILLLLSNNMPIYIWIISSQINYFSITGKRFAYALNEIFQGTY